MSATEEVLAFAQSATPPAQALECARAELTTFHQAARRGIDSPVVRALGELSVAADTPAWAAWLRGTSAVLGAGEQPEWVAVCAAASALSDTEDHPCTAVALAVGYRVAEWIAATLGPAHVAAGWCARATAGTVGAAAAAGRLLDLDVDQQRHALGICATQAAGLSSAEGTDAGALQIGKAANNAVEAVLLGRHGFTSSARPLEGRRGLFALMSATAGQSQPLDPLGRDWRRQFGQFT